MTKSASWSLCLLCLIVLAFFALAAAKDADGGTILARAPEHGRLFGPPVFGEFTIEFAVNGQAFEVVQPNGRSRLVARIDTETDEVEFVKLGGHVSAFWVADGEVTWRETIDEGQVYIRFLATRNGQSSGPRVYTQVYVRVGTEIEGKITHEFLGASDIIRPRGDRNALRDGMGVTTEPITFDALALNVGPQEWLITGMTGPRLDTDVRIFDRIVGGLPFQIDVTSIGFRDWPDTVFRTPEPRTFALAGLLVACVCQARMRGQR
ncbi:MAG: hypothetical protein O7D91_21470 [Planctomycetota bacterium]|nr:hypothetical protein [Planctomycetota bacterium]